LKRGIDEKKDFCWSGRNCGAEISRPRIFLHHRCCNELLVVQKKSCAFNRAKKISKKIFSASPQGNACASMPSSQLKFFVAVAVFRCPMSPI
jgi:hypothetical protein